MPVIKRKDLQKGMLVEITNGKDVIRGYIKEVITKTNDAKKVKVLLRNGQSGFVDHLVTKDEYKMEQFKFYNLFFYEKVIYSIWDKKANKYLVEVAENKKKDTIERTAYLFSDEKVAKEVLHSLKNDTLMLRRINRKKKISQNFKTLEVDFFRINEARKVNVKKLNEREDFYNNI